MNYIERYWRDATPEDAIKEPPMVARFKDKDEGSWHFDVLSGWNCRSLAKWLSGCLSWRFCQVYDAPDPGEGWRLIDTASEKPQDGDEIYDPSTRQWTKRLSPFTPNVLSLNRRRIAPAVTYVPFTWEDREQLRGRWIGSNDGRCQRSINTMHNDDDNGSFYLCAINAELLCTDWHFLDTGEPVGKKVVQ